MKITKLTENKESGLIKKPHPPRGKFILRKENESELLTIVLQYRLNGMVAKTTYGLYIREDQWDKERQQIKSNHLSHKSLNKKLETFKNDFDLMILEAFKEKQFITIKDIRYILSNKRLPNSKSIIEIGKDLLSIKKEQGRIGISVYLNGINALNIFEQFIKEKIGTPIMDIVMSHELIDKYISWRLNKRGNTHETVNKALVPLIMISDYLCSKNLLPKEELEKIKKSYLAKEKLSLNASDMKQVQTEHLSHEDFNKIIEYQEKCTLPITRDYLDMFRFSILTGLRWSDIVTLEWASINLDECFLKKVLFKGKRRSVHCMRLNEKAIEILAKWRERTGNKRFVFGLLEDEIDLNDDELLRKKLQSKNHSINRILKEMCKKIGISQKTFHKGRHTYAMWQLNDKIADIKEISANLGHSSIVTTENYYAKYLAV